MCRTHGGSAGQVKAAAERRQDQARAAAAVVTFGLPREVDPHGALLEELHRTAGAVAWLEYVVRDLEQGEVVWGVTEKVRKGSGEHPGTDTTKAARPNVWVQLYQQERKHLVEVAKACVSAGIEERRVRLAESQGVMLAAVVRGVLDRLDLDDRQRGLVSEVVPAVFRAHAIEAGAGGAA
ncbi:hypothetical protein [Nocardioides speluncae]|uniref:hypothetical protein n=1 Tax=Nocardioides speluncae TaxID=2670337 RepID=UPI0012B163D7|nr:hypothetical protein [Nocardioides speluncae]